MGPPGGNDKYESWISHGSASSSTAPTRSSADLAARSESRRAGLLHSRTRSRCGSGRVARPHRSTCQLGSPMFSAQSRRAFRMSSLEALVGKIPKLRTGGRHGLMSEAVLGGRVPVGRADDGKHWVGEGVKRGGHRSSFVGVRHSSSCSETFDATSVSGLTCSSLPDLKGDPKTRISQEYTPSWAKRPGSVMASFVVSRQADATDYRSNPCDETLFRKN